jgi:hypothetical protein
MPFIRADAEISAPAGGADVWLARFIPRTVEVAIPRGENAALQGRRARDDPPRPLAWRSPDLPSAGRERPEPGGGGDRAGHRLRADSRGGEEVGHSFFARRLATCPSEQASLRAPTLPPDRDYVEYPGAWPIGPSQLGPAPQSPRSLPAFAMSNSPAWVSAPETGRSKESTPVLV